MRAREEVSRGRLEALSDGVFAIVVTLLVLELKVPHLVVHDSLSQLADALGALLPKFISWALSFVTVCVIWLNHHRLMHVIAFVDRGLFWQNAHLLFWTSFIPFPTALMGDYPHNPLAVSLYGGVMCMMAMAFVLMRWHILKTPELLRAEVFRKSFQRSVWLSLVMGPLAYAVGAAVSWLSQMAAFAVYFLITLYFIRPWSTQKQE